MLQPHAFLMGLLCHLLSWFPYSSNFGPKLIMFSKEKVVTEKEIRRDDYSSHPIMETIVITLMHAAFHSEKVESEVLAVLKLCTYV